jgi:hypothetical protein
MTDKAMADILLMFYCGFLANRQNAALSATIETSTTPDFSGRAHNHKEKSCRRFLLLYVTLPFTSLCA